MSNPTVHTEEPITQSELSEQLAEIQERDEELSFRAGKTVDHLNHIKLVEKDVREKLTEEIKALDVPRLKEHHIAKIIDLQPSSLKELALIISGYTLTVNKEYQEKILSVLQANA